VLHFIDGIVIIVVVLVISAITAVNNYIKELQFCQLQSKQDDSLVTVRRKEGVTQISVNEVLVGDVVQLDTGSKIPAGLFLLL
jgi:P-type E1-E2 ATPase